MKVLESRKVRIPLIEEAVEYTNQDAKRLIEELGKPQEMPVLSANTNHPYFMVYRFQGPAELTDKSHIIYTAGAEFSEPELVIKMAKPGAVQIGWSNMKGNERRGVFPMQKAPNWSNQYAGYQVITSPGFEYDKGVMIVGAENCRKQLEVWKVSHASIDALL